MPIRIFPFLPAIVAAVTNWVAAMVAISFVRSAQPSVSVRFLVYQIAMIGFALLLAVPVRWVWLPAFLLLLAGTFLSMSVGLLYLPTDVVAGWVMVRRLESSNVDQAV